MSANKDTGKDTEDIKRAKHTPVVTRDLTYTDTDLLLYNLGCGAKAQDFDLIFEGSRNFQVIPTFGSLTQLEGWPAMKVETFLPNYDPAKLLHGEQYLKIHGELPLSGTIYSEGYIEQVLDKGKSAHVTLRMFTKDKATGKLIYENVGTTVFRGCGGFGGQRKPRDFGPASATNTPPNRKPDAVVYDKTSEESAAVYRLSGDRNPLHVDPAYAARGGLRNPSFMDCVSWATLDDICCRHMVRIKISRCDLRAQSILEKRW